MNLVHSLSVHTALNDSAPIILCIALNLRCPHVLVSIDNLIILQNTRQGEARAPACLITAQGKDRSGKVSNISAAPSMIPVPLLFITECAPAIDHDTHQFRDN
jgi:hypothetical protein